MTKAIVLVDSMRARQNDHFASPLYHPCYRHHHQRRHQKHRRHDRPTSSTSERWNNKKRYCGRMRHDVDFTHRIIRRCSHCVDTVNDMSVPVNLCTKERIIPNSLSPWHNAAHYQSAIRYPPFKRQQRRPLWLVDAAVARSTTSINDHSCFAANAILHPDGVCRVPRGGSGSSTSSSTTTATNALPTTNSFMMQIINHIPLNAWKIIFQTILTAINVFCWLIPLRSKRMSDSKLALSLANAFSAGVFLSLALGHLIPECVEGFHHSAAHLNLPHTTPYLMVLFGYLLIFFIEKVAFDPHEMLHDMEHHQHHHHRHHPPNPIKRSKVENGKANDSTTTVSTTGSGSGSGSGSHSAVILLGALAVHSILEMMALGLSDSFGDCALLTLSIALHQPAESIALLVAFLKSGMPKDDIVRYLSIFSCMGPIGVGLGMAVNQFADPVVDAVMLAIVAGTFVYVGATEVIPEEWENNEHKWKKFGALMAGIISIIVITQYTMGLHDHTS
jgi:solute carrier family 39 (zinc transporter), member 1/2/3